MNNFIVFGSDLFIAILFIVGVGAGKLKVEDKLTSFMVLLRPGLQFGFKIFFLTDIEGSIVYFRQDRRNIRTRLPNHFVVLVVLGDVEFEGGFVLLI